MMSAYKSHTFPTSLPTPRFSPAKKLRESLSTLVLHYEPPHRVPHQAALLERQQQQQAAAAAAAAARVALLAAKGVERREDLTDGDRVARSKGEYGAMYGGAERTCDVTCAIHATYMCTDVYLTYI